ncbi:hypothetical protein FJZ36_04175 [Candidatus Poribacteria bacterium]|nr:hypothetical protein [Candidatus Poribacteria bacterium]
MTRYAAFSLFLALSIGGTARAAVMLTTDRATYDRSQPVILTLKNATQAEVMWGSIGRYPTIARLSQDGREEPVLMLPQAMDNALGLLGPGDEALWRWDQKRYIPGVDDLPPVRPGDDPDEPVGIDVGDVQAKKPEPRPAGPVNSVGPWVGAGRYIAQFDLIGQTVKSRPFGIGGLAVEPRGKAAVTWAQMKTAR